MPRFAATPLEESALLSWAFHRDASNRSYARKCSDDTAGTIEGSARTRADDPQPEQTISATQEMVPKQSSYDCLLRSELASARAVVSSLEAQTQILYAQIVQIQAVLNAYKYPAPGPDVQYLQQEVLRLNKELAKARAHGLLPAAVTQSATSKQADAFDLMCYIQTACSIREIMLISVCRRERVRGTVRLSGYLATFTKN